FSNRRSRAMKTFAGSPPSMMFAAGLSLLAHAAFAQSPATPPAAPAKFETTRVADGVYTFRYLFHRNVFLVTSEGVIATDSISPDAASAMMDEIRKVTDKPVKYVVYTH